MRSKNKYTSYNKKKLFKIFLFLLVLIFVLCLCYNFMNFQNFEPLINEEELLSNQQKIGWKAYIDIDINGVYAGRIICGLFQTTPITSLNFLKYINGTNGISYKNTKFHRIITNFVVQGGSFPSLSNSERKSLRFNDEKSALELKHDARYIIQMANSGPDTNANQFCFMLKPSPHLNGKHAVFGRVLDGFDVIDSIELIAASKSGTPNADVVISNCGILEDI
eukprot:TRINITY_DN15734_c0_g1_i1.p1 TRINITY_DN15734_c0_g1~~TRINITY_DN15734_c0_g1_i1.p1  ORF type:complete len:222 (+),score=38.17 TRINITY_DN15734_c0_g1_i1:90-755(+)